MRSVLSNVLVKDKGFYKKLMMMSLPIIAQSMITIGINMLDTMMLGSYGEIQLSASSLANDFINIFQILCMGMGCGAAVLTAQYWGNHEIPSLKKAVALMLRISIVIGTVFTIVTAIFAKEIMYIYTDDLLVIEKGVIYFRWSLVTFLLTSVSLTLTQILRSIRKVNIPLYASIVGFFINIFANWVFIFGHFGMPEMQIAGAALGTVVARIIETAIILIYFFGLEKDVNFKVKDIFMKASDIMGKYIHYCLPVLASDSLLAFGNSALSIIVGHMGTSFVVAYAIIGVIQRLSTVFTSGMGQASHTIIGNTIGESRLDDAYKEAITMLVIAFGLGLLSSVLMNLTGPFIISCYDIEESTRVIAMEMLVAISIMIVAQARQAVITKGILRGGGDTGFCLAIDAVFLWIVSVPLGCLSGLVWHMSAFIVVISLKIDWIIKTVLGIFRIISKKWIRYIV